MSGGSSPRVRGTRTNYIDGQRPSSVHPRGCGEHPAIKAFSQAAYGSSPRVRGTHLRDANLRRANRFIPAGAGNTHQGPDRANQSAVHPRGCGEHCETAAKVFQKFRFIPAGAGNTTPLRLRVMRLAVHPRGCGEHSSLLPRFRACLGSSPRVRGTPSGAADSRQKLRFIPAGAGNTY